MALTAGEGYLYASVRRPEAGKPCDSSCPQRVVRWPSSGGPREVLFDTDALVRRLFFFDGELAWVALPLQASGVPETTATLSTCRVEACGATRRDLGKISLGLRGLVAEPGSRSSVIFEHQIRRAPRLPPAQQ